LEERLVGFSAYQLVRFISTKAEKQTS